MLVSFLSSACKLHTHILSLSRSFVHVCVKARKLASLLKGTERRKEELQAELSDHMMEVEKLKSDSQQLLQHNSRLQAVSDEHQNLKSTYNQLLNR